MYVARSRIFAGSFPNKAIKNELHRSGQPDGEYGHQREPDDLPKILRDRRVHRFVEKHVAGQSDSQNVEKNRSNAL